MKTFKRVRQKTGSYCGPAVFEMLVSSYGLDLDQESLVDAGEARSTIMKVGMQLPKLAQGLSKLYPDLRVWKKNDAKIGDLTTILTKGYVVAVDWQGVFDGDEYGDDEEEGRWEGLLEKFSGLPELKGTQGHYSVVLEVNEKKGYVKMADPYGHFAGKDRFISIWEFEDRWWDDAIERNDTGRKKYVFENREMFIVAKKEDELPEKLGMERV